MPLDPEVCIAFSCLWGGGPGKFPAERAYSHEGAGPIQRPIITMLCRGSGHSIAPNTSRAAYIHWLLHVVGQGRIVYIF